MDKYPLDAQALEDISRDILQHSRAQDILIVELRSLLEDAMEDVDEDAQPEWFEDAEILFKTISARKVDYENHRFNQQNGYNKKSNSPYPDIKPLPSGRIDVVDEAKLNSVESDFGPQMSEEEIARHFGEATRKKKPKKSKLKAMTNEEILEWEKAQDNSNDIYKVSARVKNLARVGGATLTPAGDMLCNTFTHTLKALYDFAETVEDKSVKIKLIEAIRNQESMPASLVAAFSAGVKG